MRNRNGRTRIELTIQEIEALHALIFDRLKGVVTSELRDETLSAIVVKVVRARKRLKRLFRTKG